jgi:hypothetical protein
MSSTIDSCHYCVAPKRHPGCHDTCPEYQKAKAEHEARKTAYEKKKAIQDGLNSQTFASVNRAKKNRKGRKPIW